MPNEIFVRERTVVSNLSLIYFEIHAKNKIIFFNIGMNSCDKTNIIKQW